MTGYQKAPIVLFGGLIPTTLRCWYVCGGAGGCCSPETGWLWGWCVSALRYQLGLGHKQLQQCLQLMAVFSFIYIKYIAYLLKHIVDIPKSIKAKG